MDLRKYALENNVPIIEEDGLKFIQDYIKENNVTRILEIGTAIGYSSINFAILGKDIFVKTLERNKDMFSYAKMAVSHFEMEKQIELSFGDALDTEVDGEFDLIFIDAAKAQYIKFFEKFKHNLSKNGVIICDNLNFHGIIHKDNDEISSRDLRQLMRKLRNFISYLKENEEFNTEFYEIGDGISISKRR
ncbi:O-methyltransferase [Mycoplasmatota bacterium WC44]